MTKRTPLPLLSPVEIMRSLSGLSGWIHEGIYLHATFSFGDFARAFAFMTTVAGVAEEMDHHPDWRNSYGTVEISLTTHESGGVTEHDIILARRINELVGSLP